MQKAKIRLGKVKKRVGGEKVEAAGIHSLLQKFGDKGQKVTGKEGRVEGWLLENGGDSGMLESSRKGTQGGKTG